MAIVFDGNAHKARILEQLAKTLQTSKSKPTLGIIQVGNDPASSSYIKMKEQAAQRIGARFLYKKFKESVNKDVIISQIHIWNHNKNVTGVLVQLPLPEQLQEKEIIAEIEPTKDVDGLHPRTKFAGPAAAAISYILEEAGVEIPGRKIVVIGSGKTAGEPIISYLLYKGARVTIVGKDTKNAKEIIKQAHILVTAVGKPDFYLKGKDIQKGAVLIGVGIRRDKKGKLIGDYDEKSVAKVASFYTPTPGGVGPITVAMLMKNLAN